MRHRKEHSHDPLDLVVKGIFYGLMPLGGVIVSLMLLGYGVHVVVA